MVVGCVVIEGLLDLLGEVSLVVLGAHDAWTHVEVLVYVDVLVQVTLVLGAK